ncbi:MAG: hypothetical protein ACRECA_12915, partial [Pseudolabrys sp.]
MPRSIRHVMVGSLAALLLCFSAVEGRAAEGALRVEAPWARASLGGVRNAIVYGALVNSGSTALS